MHMGGSGFRDRALVFVEILRFFRRRQSSLTRSHVRVGRSAHMGVLLRPSPILRFPMIPRFQPERAAIECATPARMYDPRPTRRGLATRQAIDLQEAPAGPGLDAVSSCEGCPAVKQRDGLKRCPIGLRARLANTERCGRRPRRAASTSSTPPSLAPSRGVGTASAGPTHRARRTKAGPRPAGRTRPAGVVGMVPAVPTSRPRR